MTANDAGGPYGADEALDVLEARLIAQLEARVGVLYRRFRQIAEGMKDLPLYNHAISVEPVDFQLLPRAGSDDAGGVVGGTNECAATGDHGIGVLVTPWFMSVVVLPLEPQAFRMADVGRRVKRVLPGGVRELVVGGDEVIGSYESLSLFSPLSDFSAHEVAVERARSMLAELLATPPPQDDVARITVYRQERAKPDREGSDVPSSRRDFLFGRLL